MSSIVHSGVEIHLSPEPKAAVPSWFEAVVVMVAYLKEHHLLASLAEQVRFSRARMGRYDLMDFVAALSPTCVEQLRQQVLAALGAGRVPQQREAGWWDRTGKQWLVFDVDGTRAVARQRALPQAGHLPPLIAASSRSARKVIVGASAAKWSGRAPPCCMGRRRTGLERSRAAATATRLFTNGLQVKYFCNFVGGHRAGFWP